MLQLIDVSKVYNGNVVLRGINFELESGFAGIYGPNGSGKSTMLKIIAGIEKPDCGRILFEGEDIAGKTPEEVARMGITIVYQIPRPFKNMSVIENVATPFILRVSYREAMESAMEICEFVGLKNKVNLKAGLLSQGELRLLEIGRALAAQPKLMLLDEPFSGLDVENAKRVRRILRKIKREGVDAIVTAHRMKLLRDIVDVSYEMRGGKIAEG
ncbi:MAG: ABC transporter ATP-binding protein [Archaeoglobus sp.]|uniref:ATP-binding cassette domain-containing protein n=1 Tax=Archaeoglobus sp. TaxID=1872626 RepID=UPI001D88D219|nr:ATP-binding cassette domain-containing protein [Archaeoglobus sp.]MBO8179055.1 ABC transporter ATP-binding protein [Archaeoglobus sp.]